MSLNAVLAKFNGDITQCDSLITTTYTTDSTGNYLFSFPDRQQITVAAFLNLFIAWESFLGSCSSQSPSPA